VGHHGDRCWPFRSRRVDGHCGVLVVCVLRRKTWGSVPAKWRCLPDEVRKITPSASEPSDHPLQKLVASDTPEPWCPSIPDTVSASHPYLVPYPPLLLAETTADSNSNRLGWLLYASEPDGWHQGGHGTMAAAMAENEKCIGGFVGVLCVVLRGRWA
jgi:hypothetical protein